MTDQQKKIKAEVLRQLRSMKGVGRDIEADHTNADDLLCRLLDALGHSDVTEAFNEIEKWYA